LNSCLTRGCAKPQQGAAALFNQIANSSFLISYNFAESVYLNAVWIRIE